MEYTRLHAKFVDDKNVAVEIGEPREHAKTYIERINRWAQEQGGDTAIAISYLRFCDEETARIVPLDVVGGKIDVDSLIRNW